LQLARNMTKCTEDVRAPINEYTSYGQRLSPKIEERRQSPASRLLIACFCVLPLLAEGFQTPSQVNTTPYPTLYRSYSRRKNDGIVSPYAAYQHICCTYRDLKGSYLKITTLHNFPQGGQTEIETSYNETKVSETSNAEAGKELTPLERTQLALGITPETEEERIARIEKREALVKKAAQEKIVKIVVAVASGCAAVFNFGYQYSHPITSLTLLSDMQRNSEELTVIGRNGKPTVVDFWAPWCENCKAAAPTLSAIEAEYKSQVNFILINGDKDENWGLIERFGVDAIPHLALLSSDGTVETALIGGIPKSILKADLDVLLSNTELEKQGGTDIDEKKLPLPHTMYDAFQKNPAMKKVRFGED